MKISSEIVLIAMPTPLAWRKAVSGNDRYGEVVLESPESPARGMLSQGFPRDLGELLISSSPWEVPNAKGDQRHREGC